MTAKIQCGEPMTMRIWAAIPVYIALATLIQFASSATDAAIIGGATYAVYDFTNLALLRQYDPLIAMIDTAWGALLFATTYKVMSYIRI